jgi:photosystem II stability/assembly factor-like uncharacterized protein
MFKSEDGGATWRAADTGISLAHEVRSIAVDPTSSLTLYAGTNYGVFKSTNGGDEWSRSSTELFGTGVEDVIVNPHDPSTLYAFLGAPGDYAVSKSVNGGLTWTGLGSPPDFALGFTAFGLDPSNPSTVYGGGADDSDISGVFKSTDGGHTWTFRGFVGMFVHRVNHVAVDPKNPSVVYASAVCCGQDIDGLYRSTDAGNTWDEIRMYADVFSIAFDPITPSTLYTVITGDDPWGLLKSTDGGLNWTKITVAGAPYPRMVATDPANSGTLYVIATNGLFKSTDTGASWNPLALDAPILTLTVDPKNSSILYAGTSIPGPTITGASMSGKKLTVTGEGFDLGAQIFLGFNPDGDVPEKTINDDQNPSTVLIAPKAGKHITPGQTVQLWVREPDGVATGTFPFTRPLQ